jgi:hypothetical protein
MTDLTLFARCNGHGHFIEGMESHGQVPLGDVVLAVSGNYHPDARHPLMNPGTSCQKRHDVAEIVNRGSADDIP